MALVQAWGSGTVGSTGLFNTTSNTVTLNTGQTFNGSNAVIILEERFGGAVTEYITGITVAGTACSPLAQGGDLVTEYQAAKANIWWCAANAGVSDAVVITWSAAAGQKAGFISVLEWSGVTGLDTGCENYSLASLVNPTCSTLASTTTTNTLLVSVFGNGDAGTPTISGPTDGGTWTVIGKISSGATYDCGGTAYFVDTSAAATKTGTWGSTGGSVTTATCIAAFKLATAGSKTLMMLGVG